MWYLWKCLMNTQRDENMSHTLGQTGQWVVCFREFIVWYVPLMVFYEVSKNKKYTVNARAFKLPGQTSISSCVHTLKRCTPAQTKLVENESDWLTQCHVLNPEGRQPLEPTPHRKPEQRAELTWSWGRHLEALPRWRWPPGHYVDWSSSPHRTLPQSQRNLICNMKVKM